MSIAVLTPEQLPRRLQALRWKRVLRVRGNFAALCADGPSAAIVGARAASREGMEQAHALARHLAGEGVHVISGGALGIDGAAHRGALAGGGRTTVVLGSGLERPYPQRHVSLFAEVVKAGGAIVSMLEDHVEPRRTTFVQRNKLIAALADVVVVVEAQVASGSLTTARAARELGRMVVAWPGSPGCDRLIADAMPLVGGDGDGGGDEDEQLDEVDERVLAAIRGGCAGVDQIVDVTGLAVHVVLRALSRIHHSVVARKP